jgi:hypothetical protein
MRRHALRRPIFIVLVAILGTGTVHGQDPAGKEAQKSAEAWLSLVDGQGYGESWDAAAALFKKAITREKWTAALDMVRTPLGKVTSRAPKSTTPTTTPPGAPAGEYLVVQFDTSYEQRSAAAEIVTVFKEPDAAWRVVGYFIK